jgi:hypothetical protein
MLEAERCTKGDIKCMEKKGKLAKAFYAKLSADAGASRMSPKKYPNITKITGKLGKIVREIKAKNPKYPDVYLRNVVIPAIITNMYRKKGQKRKTAAMKKRTA